MTACNIPTAKSIAVGSLFTLFLNSSIAFAETQETIEQRLAKVEKQLAMHENNSTGKHIMNNVRIAGQVSMDYNQFDGAYNAINNGATGSDIFVRRVHLRMFHKASDKLDYVMLWLSNDETTKFLVGFARYQFSDKTEIRIGKLKEDITLSVQYIGEELTGERPMVVNAFATAFQWGTQGHHLFDNGIRLSGGIFEDKKYNGSGKDADNKITFGYNTRTTWSHLDGDMVVHLGLNYVLRDLGDNRFAISEQGDINKATNHLAFSPSLASANDLTVTMLEAAFQKAHLELKVSMVKWMLIRLTLMSVIYHFLVTISEPIIF